MKNILILFFAFSLLSCKKEVITQYEPTPVLVNIPEHFPEMKIPADNPFTKEGITLGKSLFYDPILSLDHSISCNSCHKQHLAFSDDKVKSLGVNGAVGSRNSMPLFNLAWQEFFFWDGRAKSLEEQILEPVENPVEMHLPWNEAVDRLKHNPKYVDLFSKAFPKQEITKELAAKAIAQFLRTLISSQSKYDVMYKFEYQYSLSQQEISIFETITSEEWAGYDVFKSMSKGDCIHCHNGPFLQITGYSNNGLDAQFTDLGLGAITGQSYDVGRFKIPSIRNIGFTAPYMHDGRFNTIDEVINHYSSGIKLSPTIDPLMEFAHNGGVQLNQEDKEFLRAFLNTLNDSKFVVNSSYSNE